MDAIIGTRNGQALQVLLKDAAARSDDQTAGLYRVTYGNGKEYFAGRRVDVLVAVAECWPRSLVEALQYPVDHWASLDALDMYCQSVFDQDEREFTLVLPRAAPPCPLPSRSEIIAAVGHAACYWRFEPWTDGLGPDLATPSARAAHVDRCEHCCRYWRAGHEGVPVTPPLPPPCILLNVFD